MTRSSIGPDGPAIVMVSARGDLGAAGNAPIPLMRRSRISGMVSPVGSALRRLMISALTARVSAEIAAGSNSAGSTMNGDDMLAHLPARRDRIHRLDLAFPRRVDLVHHVGDDAAMV